MTPEPKPGSELDKMQIAAMGTKIEMKFPKEARPREIARITLEEVWHVDKDEMIRVCEQAAHAEALADALENALLVGVESPELEAYRKFQEENK